MSNPTRTQRVSQASAQRRQQEKEELRQVILGAAAEVFLKQGYDHFSMRQVAEKIGYSATTLYLYFENKDDLLFAVVEDAYTRFGRILAAAAATTVDPITRVVTLGKAYIEFGLHNATVYQLMFMQRPDFLLRWSQDASNAGPNALAILQEATAQAIAAGVLIDMDATGVGDALWAVVHGIVALHISMPMFDQARTMQLADVALVMTIDGLRRR